MTTIQKARGYKFEKDFCRFLERKYGGTSYRLGGTQIQLPDILHVDNARGIATTVECKSGESGILYVKQDQVLRCLDFAHKLSRYAPAVMLAFKFRLAAKKQATYYYNVSLPLDYKCSSDGCLSMRANGRHEWIVLCRRAKSFR